MSFSIQHPQFITITAYKWLQILKAEAHKQIVIDSLSFLVQQNRLKIYAFVIMDNHMHLIWQIQGRFEPAEVQRDFLKFVAQQLKFSLAKLQPSILQQMEVNRKDRQFQMWQRSSLSIALFSRRVFEQKLNYIHNNPVKAGICDLPEEYKWSSASYYLLNDMRFEFLSHYEG